MTRESLLLVSSRVEARATDLESVWRNAGTPLQGTTRIRRSFIETNAPSSPLTLSRKKKKKRNVPRITLVRCDELIFFFPFFLHVARVPIRLHGTRSFRCFVRVYVMTWISPPFPTNERSTDARAVHDRFPKLLRRVSFYEDNVLRNLSHRNVLRS